MNFRKNTGITLIALVITIIVLLILAGVSLNLIAGENAIIGKAEKAVSETELAQIKEEVDLAIAYEKLDYWEKRQDDKTINTSCEGYIKEKLESETGITTSSGATIKLDETNVVYEKDDKTTIVGTCEEIIGKVEFADKNQEENLDNNQEENLDKNQEENLDKNQEENLDKNQEENLDKSFASQIDSTNYGDYVDLETTILERRNGKIYEKLGGSTPTEQPLADWRIFYKGEDGGIYLILTDFLSYSYETSATAGSSTGLSTGLSNKGSTCPFNWRSTINRTDLLTRLENKNAWNKLLSSTYIDKGIWVKGAIDLEIWVSSLNSNKENTTLCLANDTTGYYIGTSENPTTYEITVSNTDTLYFPHTVALSTRVAGYWTTAPAAKSDSTMMTVFYDGRIGYDSYYNNIYSVRPVVYIPAGIVAEKNAENVWELKL